MTERERQRLRQLFNRRMEEDQDEDQESDEGSGEEYDLMGQEDDLIDHLSHYGHCIECLKYEEGNPTNPRICEICVNWDNSGSYQISDLEIVLERRYIIHPDQYCRAGIAQIDILQHTVLLLSDGEAHDEENKENISPSRNINHVPPTYSIRYMVLFTHFTNDRCLRSFSLHTGKQNVQFCAEFLHLQRMGIEVNYVILEKNPLLDLGKIWAIAISTLKTTKTIPRPHYWTQNRDTTFLIGSVYEEGIDERAKEELLKPHTTLNTRTVSSLQNLAKRTIVRHRQLRELAKTFHPMLKICRSEVPNFAYFLCLKFQRHKSIWSCNLNPYAINYSVDIANL